MVQVFTFNPFQENTYVIYDQTGECVIIDPGCYDNYEEQTLLNFLKEKNLKPVRLINTHCHIDHILGNAFISSKFSLNLEINQNELPVLESGERVATMYGLNYSPSPEARVFLGEKDTLKFGQSELRIILAPGHSPGSICFYNEREDYLIAGDVLFHESIGRTDLPLGHHDTLIRSIKTKLFLLPESCKVFPGHGPSTTIGHEKKFNPFLN